jgi:hypothetical protein
MVLQWEQEKKVEKGEEEQERERLGPQEECSE